LRPHTPPDGAIARGARGLTILTRRWTIKDQEREFDREFVDSIVHYEALSDC